MNITSLSAQQLRHAADLKEKIASLQNELAHYLGASASSAPGRKSRMSAAGRARIIAAQKLRWARANAGKPAKKASKGKRTMSAAARKKIAAVARARWARVKAAGKKSL
jgi:cell division septum initiation protein DivIVA